MSPYGRYSACPRPAPREVPVPRDHTCLSPAPLPSNPRGAYLPRPSWVPVPGGAPNNPFYPARPAIIASIPGVCFDLCLPLRQYLRPSDVDEHHPAPTRMNRRPAPSRSRHPFPRPRSAVPQRAQELLDRSGLEQAPKGWEVGRIVEAILTEARGVSLNLMRVLYPRSLPTSGTEWSKRSCGSEEQGERLANDDVRLGSRAPVLAASFPTAESSAPSA